MKLTKSSFGLVSWAVTVSLLLSWAATAWAEEALLPPQQVIQHSADELQTTLQKPEFKNDFKKATQVVNSIIEPHVDFDRVSMLILGKYWKTATPEQRERFKRNSGRFSYVPIPPHLPSTPTGKSVIYRSR